MEKDDKQIMVIPRDVLFDSGGDNFNGLYYGRGIDFESRILSASRYMRRGDAEQNPSFKQPIGYCLVVNPTLKKVFAYQRETDPRHYEEDRLAGKWTWGVGGHIEIGDKSHNPIKASMERELKEEIKMDGRVYDIQVIGYINDDTDSVGSVHFGVLYSALTDSTIVSPNISEEKKQEAKVGELKKLEDVEAILSNPHCVVESWSRISMVPLRQMLK